MSSSTAEDPGAQPDDEQAATSDTRRLVQWVIIAGLVLGIAAAALLVWEAWSANRDALEHNREHPDEAAIFSVDAAMDGASSAAPSRPGPPAGADSESS